MLFNSFEFLLFFPIVTIGYFLLAFRFRWMWLLAASCFFYMFFKPEYILILAFTIMIDYYAGILIERTQEPKKRKWFLVMSLIANISVLAIFKYYNFINDNITGFVSVFHLKNNIPYLHMILPIGLSFHTFQAMSYTIEVYRGNHKAEKHFGIYALYVMFYPQLVAGPIERPQNILYQFHTKKYFTYDNAVIGLKLILYGLFKKVVIADRVGGYVNAVYQDLNHMHSASVMIAVALFSLQLYCDFSGYSDIARGTAKVMGFDLLVNFNKPFQSTSITEFWRRWHISLSTWMNDYLFTPMNMSLRDYGKLGICFALLVTFFISGLWHGAGWTFVIYGLLHGIAIVYETLTKKFRKRVFSILPAAMTQLLSSILVWMYVAFTWIFFRAENLGQAAKVLGKLSHLHPPKALNEILVTQGRLNAVITICVLCLFILLSNSLKWVPKRFEPAFLGLLCLFIIIFGKNASTEFIYFQF